MGDGICQTLNPNSSFSAQVDRKFTGGSGIWGPHSYAESFIQPQGPKPPQKRDSTWGVGEEAELINFSSVVHPVSTKWTYCMSAPSTILLLRLTCLGGCQS
jgi:hypothetical protein